MKSEITYDDFAKLDIRVGTITKAERIPKSKKLLKLEVFFGSEIGSRTILAGIASSYDPEGAEGLKVMAIINLAPRQMMGETSHGMLLAGMTSTNGLQLAECYGADDGAEIG